VGNGVYTASSGNMAQGVAWMGRELGVPAKVFVPDHAPEAKIAAIQALGAGVARVTYDEWWAIMLAHGSAGEAGHFVHPVCDATVMAGNGTIGLEIAEDLPDVDVVIAPFGGGGMACGIAAALQGVRPAARVLAAEVEGAAPLAASLAAGAPATIEYKRSFVDGIGSASVLPEMWPLVRSLVSASIVVPVAEVEAALRLVVNRVHVIVEGAAAAALAAAHRSCRARASALPRSHGSWRVKWAESSWPHLLRPSMTWPPQKRRGWPGQARP
jgi:threonine dehydratase